MPSEVPMSGADEKIRAVIERVAREVTKQCCMEGYGPFIAGILEERLLPLLLAGQAMRDEYLQFTPATTVLTWDRALAAAAQGQPEKESGR